MSSKLFFGGPIITMEEPLYAEAILISRGKIAAVGKLAEVEAQAPEDTRRIDLKGKTLMPAFLDAHSHISQFAATLGLAPLEGLRSFEEIGAALQRYREENKLPPDQWLIGFGYDHNYLREQRHPDAAFLDSVCSENPVIVVHASGHMGAVNSAGLRRLGITAETVAPEGGKIGHKPDGQPDGYLEENAFIRMAGGVMSFSGTQIMKYLEKAQQIYLSFGITTAQDGKVARKDFDLLAEAAKEGRLSIDVVAYADMKTSEALLEQQAIYRNYQRRLRLGGYKIFLDGSPQGKTAWMTKPYEGETDGYRGYPIYTDEAVREFLQKATEENVQLLAHCNGDAAADQLISAYEKVRQEARRQEDIRPVMIHAQTIRKDQVAKMARLGMIASFFTAHTYYWGDVHRKNLGEERAKEISPAATAQKEGLVYTFHQDTPVLLPDMMRTVWCAVNRVSKSGASMGEEERISVLDALKAVTLNAAYQYFEEDRKGSLKAGKLADLVILGRDPLKEPKTTLCDIRVLETLKEGSTVYLREKI